MNNSFLLNAAEVADLTGYQKPNAQFRWLEREGFPFLIGGDGRPKVLRELVVRRLGGTAHEKQRPAPQLRLT